MIEVTMPRLSDSMEEGTILQWLVAEGAAVSRGDELAEIETDKATMTYEADSDGLLHLVAREGDTLAVGAPIAVLLSDGEEPPVRQAQAISQHEGGGDRREATSPAATLTPPVSGDGRLKASPLARRVAAAHGVELAGIAGSGPNGRVVRADVEAYVQTRQNGNGKVEPAPRPEGNRGEITRVEPSRTQALIARRMAESRATIPSFDVSMDIDVTDLLALRRQLKDAGRKLSVNDFVVKATGLTLRDHPRVNGAWKDGGFETYGRVNVGIAVAAEGTLIVPTIFDADRKPVTEIAADARALAERVRDQAITPPELSGGTCTVSNLGMFGVTSFNAVINPGQAAILAVGAAIPRDDRQVMNVTLSSDHRIIYGADAAAFLTTLRDRLEHPLTLLA
ncbi:MAG: 2-oxo acid dehydrogenase subunit E2 [Solirubrobacteraceae bacterium]|nr:2-oxo acid dehydrogenase subunit E2 [Solirubrobacteraceae bacterium]